MDIWTYPDEDRDVERVRVDVTRSECAYCDTRLVTPRLDYETRAAPDEARYAALRVKCCPMCGWWTVSRDSTHRIGPCGTLGDTSHESFGSSGVLRNLSLVDQSIPLDAVRKYLAARYDARFEIDPAKLETVVASVYSDLGYTAVAVGRSGDGGIDVMLEDSSGGRIGVQVKRNRGKIEAEAIRAFTGSLYLKDILSGIFVTTSVYTRGARETAAEAGDRRIPIELIDAQRFYQELGLAQRAAYDRINDPSAPYANARLLPLSSYEFRRSWLRV